MRKHKCDNMNNETVIEEEAVSGGRISFWYLYEGYDSARINYILYCPYCGQELEKTE